MNTIYPTCPHTDVPCAVCPCVACTTYIPEPGEVAAVLQGLGCPAPRGVRYGLDPELTGHIRPAEPARDSGPAWCQDAGPWEWSDETRDWMRTLDAQFGVFRVGQVQTRDGRRSLFSRPVLGFDAEFVPTDSADLATDLATIRDDLQRAEQAMQDALTAAAGVER